MSSGVKSITRHSLGTSTSVPDTVQAVAWSAHRSNGYEANES
jgi:molybdopterin synthase catalytic subunit